MPSCGKVVLGLADGGGRNTTGYCSGPSTRPVERAAKVMDAYAVYSVVEPTPARLECNFARHDLCPARYSLAFGGRAPLERI